MGGGKSSTSTQSVSIPPEVLARYNAVNARAEDVAKQPFQQYGGQFVAPLTETQQAGISATSAASQSAQPYFGAATGLTMSGARDVGPLTQDQISYYQNPAMLATLAPTQAALQQQQGQQLAQQQAEAIKAGAFGGSGANMQRQLLRGQQQLAMGQAIAPIYQRAYETGLQTAQGQQGVVASDLARRMQAGTQIAGLGTGAQAAALQGAQAQIGAGTLGQQTQQADLTARYQQFLQERGYDFQVAQFLANIAMGTGALSGSTTTTTQPRGFFSNRGGFKTGETVRKAYGGGIDPNSMGGAVYEPGAFERGGYATDGRVDPTDISSILAQMRSFQTPMGGAGPYGQAAGAAPHGPSGIVPQQQLHTSKLMTAGSLPKQQQGDFATLSKGFGLADEATKGLTGQGLKERAGEKLGLRDSPEKVAEAKGEIPMAGVTGKASSAPMPMARPDASEMTTSGSMWDKIKDALPFEHGGGVMPRDHFGLGGSTVNPYENRDPSESYIEDTLQEEEEAKKPEMLKPSGGGGGGGSGSGLGSDIAKGLAMAKTAASLFAMSDKRLKDNVRPVGKTFDGQNIYSYNLGDKPTQLGLIAQEVRSKHPDAVGHRGKYLTVNYDEATRNAANRGHFYEGGVVPRQHFKGGGFDDAYETTLGHEGGYTVDTGGPTMMGISSKANSDVDLERVKNDPEYRRDIYRTRYWEPIEAEKLDPKMQNLAYDTAVNLGVGRTKELLAQAENDPAKLLQLRQQHYNDLVSKNPKEYGKYAQGWNNRVNSYAQKLGMEPLAFTGSEGGLGRTSGQQAIQRATSGEGKGLGASQEPGFFDRNKGIILPVLQGIGAMASSKSISPWAAALQGLGAGAKAYGEEESRQAGIEQTKAQTFESSQRGSNLSFLQDGKLVRMPDGSLMLTVEALKKGLIPMGGKIAGLAENSAASKFLASIGINAPAASQYLQEPEPKTPDLGPKPVDQSIDANMTDRGIFGNSSRQLAQKDAYRTMGLTPEGAAQVSKDYETSTAAAGVAANQNTPIINSLAGNTSKIVNAQGLDAPGKTNEFRANIANGVNTLARSMGYKGEDVLAGDTNAAIQNKLNTFLASQSTEAAGQHNLGALRTMLGAMANPDMPPQAQAKIASQIMTMTQKAKDRDAHREVFGDVSGGSFATAGQAFDNDTKGRYEREERLLGALILKDPQAVEKLTAGNKSPQVIEQYFRNLSKVTGVPYTPGLSRYFVSGVQ
jgi:hypothetical protein